MTLSKLSSASPLSCVPVLLDSFSGIGLCDFKNLTVILYQTIFIKPLCRPMDRCGCPVRVLEFVPPILVNSREPFHVNSLDGILIHNIEFLCSPNFFLGS